MPCKAMAPDAPRLSISSPSPRELDRTQLLLTSKPGQKPIFVVFGGNDDDMQRGIDVCKAEYDRERAALPGVLRDSLAQATGQPCDASADHLPSPYASPCTEQRCVHCVADADGLPRKADANVRGQRSIVVACDPGHTRLRDDCVECVEDPADGSIVTRVSTAYPAALSCASAADRAARLATLSAFVTKNMNASSTSRIFGSSPPTSPSVHRRGVATSQPPPGCVVGFRLGCPCLALTVECVFERDGDSPGGYAQNHAKTQVYVSPVVLTHVVTDEELYRYMRTVEAGRAEPQPADANAAACETLARLYRLAVTQGWAGEPLFTQCRTTPVYGSYSGAAPLLRQRFNPDYSAQLNRFCFQRLVSEALLRCAVAFAGLRASAAVPLVCRLPCGDELPCLTEQQAAALAEIVGTAATVPAGRPGAHEWRDVCEAAAMRGVQLLAVFAELGMPLRGDGGRLLGAAFRPFTPELYERCYCVVLANKPMRDYACLVNVRCAACLVRRCEEGLACQPAVFGAWVRYWAAVDGALRAYKAAVTHRLLQAHLLRAMADAPDTAEPRSCVVEGRVLARSGDSTVTVVFPALRGMQHTLAWSAAEFPALGMPVLFVVRAEVRGCPSFCFIESVAEFASGLPSSYVPELRSKLYR